MKYVDIWQNLDIIAKSYKEDLIKQYSQDVIINNEQQWIFNNLTLLYRKDNNILNYSMIVNPYLLIKNIEYESNNYKTFVFVPKNLAINDFFIFYAELDKVNIFLKSLVNYADPFTGNEIIEILSKNNLYDNHHITNRISLIIRKFLSYQYIVQNFNVAQR